MQFDTTYLTEAGRSLATGTLGGLDKIQFPRAVASSHDYSATPVNDLKKLTSIEDVQQTVEYSRIIKKDDTTLTMRVDFPSKDVTTAYSLYTVGFYARPENGDEILYGVLPSSLPDYIAAYDGKSNLNDSFQTDTTVSDADNVLITVSQAGSLNEADLDAIFASKHIATIDDIKANIPATVIDGSKPADFKESVTLEKGAVDGEGNAIATSKDVSDGDATTLTSAKDYADTKISGKADDSTVVHTADMRKPANQVASIDEVNVKADDSKVVHDNHDNTITVNGTSYDLPKSGLTSLQLVDGGSFNDLPLGTILANGHLMTDGPDNTHSFTTTTFYFSQWNGRKAQIAIADNASSMFLRIFNAGAWTSWAKLADDSKVVHTADMRKPASDVAGIEEVNAKQDKLDYTPANAANVVDRNPDTGVVSTPTDFTKLTVNGGKSVATRDDLKSLEASAWHTITGKSDSLSAYTCMYRKNNEQKYVDLVLYGIMGIAKNVYLNKPDTQTELLDLKNIVSTPKNVRGMIACASPNSSGGGATYDLEISGTKLKFAWSDHNVLSTGKTVVSANDDGDLFMRITFD
ncbi:hypothetical protein H3M12_02525 [Levilactobacillus suantsaii]|uniref:pyocin knob domain-containing protein n=1 Tax=Levilactobacillus suantsaii TaxID=2292255 RepID=UPI0015F5EB87|nr:pyocin knob domain-containing protein [Levilactobacillus suantsaii]QMU08568.1 hypothetical protein H3M12_02525 [Levilactobacillus suantsaii]